MSVIVVFRTAVVLLCVTTLLEVTTAHVWMAMMVTDTIVQVTYSGFNSPLME